MSVAGMAVENVDVFNPILVLWALDCGLLLICRKEQCTAFEALMLFVFSISQKEENDLPTLTEGQPRDKAHRTE